MIHQPLTLITFLEEEVIQSEAHKHNTFIDILESYPTIQIEFVHTFLEPVGLGWYSYQENATNMLRNLFILRNMEQNMEFHILPSYNPFHKRQVSIEEYGTNIALVFGFDMPNFPERFRWWLDNTKILIMDTEYLVLCPMIVAIINKSFNLYLTIF